MPKTFCVVGHDARQQAAARVLRRAGYGVTAADNAAAADYILLPMSQGRVSDEVARALQGAGQGTLILAGRPGMPVRMAAREAGLPLIDYFLRPELECLNAVPTAEELGLHAEHALALPGRCAPQTAGALIAQTVLAILEERDSDERSTAP